MKRAQTPLEEPFRVLFVCTGNRARSPFAAGLAEHLWSGPSAVEFTSAGTEAVNGLPMDSLMRDELGRRGVADPDFSSRHLTRAIVQPAQLILTMDVTQRAQVVRDHISTARRLFTFGQFLESAEANFDGDSLPALVDVAYRTRRRSAAMDVPDPFGRGAGVAADTARTLTELTERLMVVLARGAGT